MRHRSYARFESRPPAQPVDITSSTMLIHAEDDDLLDRRGGQQCESSEEDSGISDCSDDSASDGRVSPETSGELPTRGSSVERPAGWKRPKRKTKPRVAPADTGGRDADPMSADTPADLPAPVSLSTTSADTLLAVQAAPGDTPASLEGMPGTPEEVTAMAAHADDMAGFPEGMPGKSEDVTATADTSDGVADTSDSMADYSDRMADTPDDGADSQEDGQVDFGLPLSAL